MLDAPGPWGTGPFILSKGYSSILNVQSIITKNPYASTWFTVDEERTPLVVLEANRQYWNQERGPQVERVVFRNDLTRQQALDLCLNTEGQVDIVTEVRPEDAYKVKASPFAKLVHMGGDRVLAGTFNRYLKDVDFSDRRLRLAFNLAIDQTEVVQKAFYGYAEAVPALTPQWAQDFPEELKPIKRDTAKAKQLFSKLNWPAGRPLRIVTPDMYKAAAEIIGQQLRSALGFVVEIRSLSPHNELKWRRVLAEKKLVPNWDIFLGSPFALFYEGTPAYFHREFLGLDGALRAGPVLGDFEKLFAAMVKETDRKAFLDKSKEIDRYVYREALALFICAPYDIYAVNKHVNFKP